jgi:gas vesicle protein
MPSIILFLLTVGSILGAGVGLFFLMQMGKKKRTRKYS